MQWSDTVLDVGAEINRGDAASILQALPENSRLELSVTLNAPVLAELRREERQQLLVVGLSGISAKFARMEDRHCLR
jgi:hypothetical protein